MSRTYSNWARLGNKWTRYSVICVRNGRFEVGNEEKMKNTILIIPGNPGNDQFYVDFAADIGELWKRDCRIFIVSHLNHIPLPPGLSKLDNTQMSRKFKLSIIITIQSRAIQPGGSSSPCNRICHRSCSANNGQQDSQSHRTFDWGVHRSIVRNFKVFGASTLLIFSASNPIWNVMGTL